MINVFDKIDPIDRDFLIRVAEASPFPMNAAMAKIVAAFKAAGRFADASEDEIEAFDEAMIAMEVG